MYQIRTAPAECRRKTRVPRNHTYDSGFTRRIVMERHRKNLFFFFCFSSFFFINIYLGHRRANATANDGGGKFETGPGL